MDKYETASKSIKKNKTKNQVPENNLAELFNLKNLELASLVGVFLHLFC
jgi:hypothetical protein